MDSLELRQFGMKLHGKLNSIAFRVEGSGACSDKVGLVEGRYHLARLDNGTAVLPGMDHWIFNCLIVTGYPSETATPNGQMNPFKRRAYRYRRKLDFFERGSIDLETSVRFSPDGMLSSEFKAVGMIDVPMLIGVEPCVETWAPVSDTSILGTFTMVWRTSCGSFIPCSATTMYDIAEGSPNISKVYHRSIHIEASGDLASFTRRQVSTLIEA